MPWVLMQLLVGCRAEKLLPAFKAFLQSPGPDEDARRSAAYVQQLEQLQDNLVSNKQPYIGGQEPSAADLALGPKLYHSTVALKHFKVSCQAALAMHVESLLSQQTGFQGSSPFAATAPHLEKHGLLYAWNRRPRYACQQGGSLGWTPHLGCLSLHLQIHGKESHQMSVRPI